MTSGGAELISPTLTGKELLDFADTLAECTTEEEIVETVSQYLKKNPAPDKVFFSCAYEQLLRVRTTVQR